MIEQIIFTKDFTDTEENPVMLSQHYRFCEEQVFYSGGHVLFGDQTPVEYKKNLSLKFSRETN